MKVRAAILALAVTLLSLVGFTAIRSAGDTRCHADADAAGAPSARFTLHGGCEVQVWMAGRPAWIPLEAWIGHRNAGTI